MEEIFSALGFTIGMGLAVVIIVGALSFRMDNTSQVYCEDAVHEFVDSARQSGYVSPNKYMQMVETMNNTGNIYEVSIYIESYNAIPQTDKDDNTIQNKYESSYKAYHTDEILDYMFPDTGENQNWYLKNGDFIQVSYEIKNNTIASQLIGFLTTHHNLKTIFGNYSGYVGSTER